MKKLGIENTSSIENIKITLLSSDGSKIHLENKVLKSGENLNLDVKGGLKLLIVMEYSKKNTIWWRGMIPIGSENVKINPDNKTVTYKGRKIINLEKPLNLYSYTRNPNNEQRFYHNRYFIFSSLLIIAIIVLFIVFKRKKVM